MNDDSERNRELVAVHQNNSLNSALLELSNEGILLLNKEGRFIFSTNYAQKLLGYKQSDFALIHFPDLADSENNPILKKALISALSSSEKIEIKGFKLNCKDGISKYFDCNLLNKLDDDTINAIVFTFRAVANENLLSENCGTISTTNLLENELFTGCVLASLSDQVAVISNDGTILAVNKAWEEFSNILGISKPVNGSVGSNYITVCQSAIAEGDKEVQQTLDGILSVFSKKSLSYQQEYPCFTPTIHKWFILNVLPLGDDETKVVLTHHDITQRKLAEANLTLTAEKLQIALSKLGTILDSSLDLICTVNSDMEFVTVNKASYSLLGYTPEELIGTNFLNILHESDKIRTVEAANKILKGVLLPLFENNYIHKNGRIVPLLWSVNWDDKTGISYCVAKDMTEKKKLQKSIEVERDQYRKMFLKATSAVVMLKGPNHIYELANPLYLELVGKKSVVGQTVAEVIPEVVAQGFLKVLDSVYKTGEPVIGKEVLIKLDRYGNGKLVKTYLNFIFQAYRNTLGEIEGIFFFANDVTEEIKARKMIEKSEKFFKGVTESSQDMIATISAKGKILYASPIVSKKFGFNFDEILQLNITDIIHPEDEKLGSDVIAEVLKNPSLPISCKAIRQRKKDGTFIWVEATLTNFLKTDGINAIVSNFRDITERKNSETLLQQTLKELEDEKTRLHAAQKVAKIGSWQTNATTYEASWSAETFHILGADPSDFEASYEAFLSFVHPDDLEMVATNFLDSLDGLGMRTVEHRIITAQGINKWIEEKWTIDRDADGNPLIAIGTCQDITERKAFDDKILKSETKLKAAQHIAHVGSWEVDLLLNEHSWSDEFYHILEIDLDEMPSNETYYSKVHPEDLDIVKSKIRQSYTDNTISSFLFRFIRKNGEIGFASTEWKAEYDSGGKPVQLFGILRDLTIQYKAEQERQKMVIDIIQRNKDLEQFSYIISHNLRSPVANIIGLSEELKDVSHSPETIKELREAISSDVKRLEEVILDLNHIVQTKRDIVERKEEVVLSELVENILLSINYLIEKKNVHIQFNFEAIDKIWTIKSYMQSVFYNLISNSIKYRKKDSALLLEIETKIIDKQLVIIFKDNGIGIDLTRFGTHIFGLYKRFHPGTEGKGLGLYMVKTQIETMGGTISVNSEKDVGTEFTIEFKHFKK